MTKQLHYHHTGIATISLVFLVASVLAACSGTLVPTPPVSVPTETIPVQIDGKALSVVEFYANLVQPLSGTGKVYLNILDEVTGLALNPQRYEMTPGENGMSFSASVAFEVGSVIKYRYTSEGSISTVEYTPLGQQIRYRMFRVDGPSSVVDTISAWNNQPYNGETGRITGTITGDDAGSSLAGALVTAAGVLTLTSSDGTFVLEGIPVGTHNLFIYTLDGKYCTFQQGAVVEAGKTTPALVTLTSAPHVNITFNLTIPIENIVGQPVRLAGNLYQTGNTFSDLAGGLSVIASRLPLLNQESDGKYSLTLSLPAGADFRYKYTLGDGFWNAEQTGEGGFQLRQLIVPEVDTVVNDEVATWHSQDFGEITFSLQAPANTPPGDYISIQFNPYGWTEPLPMWSMGNNQWLYILYSPMDMLPSLSYRFCRNSQCSSADEAVFAGANSPGRPVSLGKDPQLFQDTVDSWIWWQPSNSPTTVSAAEITSHGSSFMAGFEFSSFYHPSMQQRFLPAYQAIQQVGANWVVLTPSWSVSSSNPPVIEPLPGRDPLWQDLVNALQEANGQGIKSAIFPTEHFSTDAISWWESSAKDPTWWDAWFKRYKEMMIYHADAAAAGGASALILGGEAILPALPGGLLADGNPSLVPEDASARWSEIISVVREHFSGQVFWAASFKEGLSAMPDFLDQLDGLYLLWSAPLSKVAETQGINLEQAMGSLLDEDIAPLQELTGGQIILAVQYPSAGGVGIGCIKDDTGDCVPPSSLDRPLADIPSVTLDLQEQVDLYNAVFAAVNGRDWVSGIISRDYYYPAALMDKSASVNGKPAQDVIWYWFPGLTSE